MRNERGLPRVGKIEIEIDPHFGDAERTEAAEALKGFEELCMVTQSVREGVEIACKIKGL